MVDEFLKNLKKQGYKYKDIAEITGFSPTYLSNLVSGSNCSIETAIKLADAFGVSLDTVIGRKPPENEISAIQHKILQITEGDQDLQRAVLRSAEAEKLIREKEGRVGRAKVA